MSVRGGLAVLSLWLVLGAGPAWADMAMGAMFPALKVRAGSKATQANEQGIEQYDQDNWEAALNLFTEAIKADPKSAEAYYNLALALDQLGNHHAAAGHFRKAYLLGKEIEAIQTSRVLLTHICNFPE